MLTYIVCKNCGKRKFEVSGLEERGSKHSSIEKQKDKWLAGSNSIGFTDEGEILDVSMFPTQGINNLMERFKDDKEFGKLIKNNKLVEDALGQLEVALKLSLNNS